MRKQSFLCISITISRSKDAGNTTLIFSKPPENHDSKRALQPNARSISDMAQSTRHPLQFHAAIKKERRTKTIHVRTCLVLQESGDEESTLYRRAALTVRILGAGFVTG